MIQDLKLITNSKNNVQSSEDLIYKLAPIFIHHLALDDKECDLVLRYSLHFVRTYDDARIKCGASVVDKCGKRDLLSVKRGLLNSLEQLEKCFCDSVIKDAFLFEVALNNIFAQDANEFHNKKKSNQEKYNMCVDFVGILVNTIDIITSSSEDGRMLSPQMRKKGQLERLLVRTLARYYKQCGGSLENAIRHCADQSKGAVFDGPFVNFVEAIFKEFRDKCPCGEIVQEELAGVFSSKL